MGIKDNLKRGTLDLLLLSLLDQREMYAYELSGELARQSNNLFLIQDASMYTALYRLLEKGLISDRREQVGKRKFRVYYRLEDSGKAYLKQITQEYYDIQKGVLSVIQNKEKAQLNVISMYDDDEGEQHA